MDTSSASGILSARVDGPVATISITNPAKRNALVPESYRAIGDLVRAAGNDPSIRAVIITGDRDAFSSGMDLAAFAGVDVPGELGVVETMNDIEHMAVSITRTPVPVIAAVEGACAGIGASLAFLCDLIVAGEGAFFSIPFTAIGLVPDGGAVATLTASVGRHRAMRMALLHTRISAAEAVDHGLAAEIAPDALARAADIAAGFLHAPREALARTKAAVNRASLAQLPQALETEATVQTRLLGTPEHAEGVAAFMERRTPRFP